MAKHKCSNSYNDDGAKGACYFHITDTNKEGVAYLEVGHSCVVVHAKPIPVSWLAELVAIATLDEGGVEGFLKKHGIAGNDDSHGSYALACDPALPSGEIYSN